MQLGEERQAGKRAQGTFLYRLQFPTQLEPGWELYAVSIREYDVARVRQGFACGEEVGSKTGIKGFLHFFELILFLSFEN